MTGTGPKSIQSYINGDAVARARQAALLRESLAPLWRQVAGADTAAHSHPTRLEGRRLWIHADGPLWANRIRHRYAELVGRLQRFPELRQVSELRVRIVPTQTTVKPAIAGRMQPQLSTQASEVIQEVANDIEDKALREALLRLGRRTR